MKKKQIDTDFGLAHGVTLTVDVPQDVLTVVAWPDEIQVTIHARDGLLTVEQASELVTLLQAAIEQVPTLDFTADGYVVAKSEVAS